MRERKRCYSIHQIELLWLIWENLLFITVFYCISPSDTVSLDTFLKSGGLFLKVTKLINEVILSEKFSNPRPLDPLFILCFLPISLPTNISKNYFRLKAMVKMQGLSMCSISKYPRHFLQLSFLALIFSQYSCELSNLLQISDAMITSKIMSLYLLTRMSLLGSLSYINLRQILSVSFSTW